ncbi:MAG: citrate lyase holo-[acyl-carrier protein] synthase [Clostridium sp.]|nr:citrate lyase holo-[acyl-carrier protein] synthase [Clostridium sp.]
MFGRDAGCQIIRDVLKQKDLPLIYEEILEEKTGHEAFFCVDAEAEIIKQALAVPEEEIALGRLYDIDIIRKDRT